MMGKTVVYSMKADRYIYLQTPKDTTGDPLGSALEKAKSDFKARKTSALTEQDFSNTIQGPALKVAPVGVASIGYNFYKGTCNQTSFASNLVFNSPTRPCYNLQLVNDDSTNWLQWSFDGVSIAGELEVAESTNDLLIPAFTQIYLLSVLQGTGGSTTSYRLKIW